SVLAPLQINQYTPLLDSDSQAYLRAPVASPLGDLVSGSLLGSRSSNRYPHAKQAILALKAGMSKLSRVYIFSGKRTIYPNLCEKNNLPCCSPTPCLVIGQGFWWDKGV